MKKMILVSTIPICVLLCGKTVYSSTTSLSAILSKYCVPKQATDCEMEGFLATYNEKKGCECKNMNYMYYSNTARKCFIKCPAGSIPEKVKGCPAGYTTFQIVK